MGKEKDSGGKDLPGTKPVDAKPVAKDKTIETKGMPPGSGDAPGKGDPQDDIGMKIDPPPMEPGGKN